MIETIGDEHECSELNILIFEFMDIHMGIDMAQVFEICEPEAAEEKSQTIFQMHERIPYITTKVDYRTPGVIMVQHDDTMTGIVIDMPQEIVSLPSVSVLPLPDVIERYKGSTPVWGVALHKKRVVLLIDLLCLINNVSV